MALLCFSLSCPTRGVCFRMGCNMSLPTHILYDTMQPRPKHGPTPAISKESSLHLSPSWFNSLMVSKPGTSHSLSVLLVWCILGAFTTTCTLEKTQSRKYIMSIMVNMSGKQNYLLTTRNGHRQSGWSPIGREGLYFHAMCKNRVSVSGWSLIGCDCLRTNFNIPCALPTALVFQLVLSVTQKLLWLEYVCWICMHM